MRILLDISNTPVGTQIANVAENLRRLGDDDLVLAEAVEALCDAVDHPLLVDEVFVQGTDLVLRLDDVEAEAAQGQAWMGRAPSVP